MGVPYAILRGPTFVQPPTEGGGEVSSRWWCEPCDRYFVTEEDLARHRESGHEAGQPCKDAAREGEVGMAGQAVPQENRPVNGAASLVLVRHGLGVSRQELSRRTGVPVQALALFENGWVDLWDEDKVDIAKALDVPYSILWGPSTDVVVAWLERPEATA